MFWLLEKFLRWFYTMPLDDKDLLIIDRSLEPINNKVAVCFIITN